MREATVWGNNGARCKNKRYLRWRKTSRLGQRQQAVSRYSNNSPNRVGRGRDAARLFAIHPFFHCFGGGYSSPRQLAPSLSVNVKNGRALSSQPAL